MRFLDLRLEDVGYADSPFDLRPGWRDRGDLCASIRRFGVLSPIEVQSERNRCFPLVHGFQRVRAAEELGLEAIPAVVVPDSEEIDLFLKKLEQSFFAGPLRDLDSAIVLERLTCRWGFSSERLLEEFLPRMGLKPDLRTLEQYQALARLPEDLRRAADEGLEVSLALKLSRRPADVRVPVIEAVRESRLGRNKQRELFELWDEIVAARRADMPVGKAADGRALWREIVGDRRDWGSVVQRLRAARFPLLAQRQGAFEERRRALRLPSAVEIASPGSFEGDSLEIRLRVRDADALSDTIQALGEACGDERMRRLFELL